MSSGVETNSVIRGIKPRVDEAINAPRLRPGPQTPHRRGVYGPDIRKETHALCFDNFSPITARIGGFS